MMFLKKELKKYKTPIFIVLVGLFIAVLYAKFSSTGLINSENRIERKGYADEDSEYRLYVSGAAKEEIAVDIPVHKKKYTDEELKKVFEKCMDILSVRILGKNNSLDEIQGKLDFVSSIDEYDVQVDISPENTELIDFDGNVFNENTETPEETTLDIILVNQGRKEEYKLDVRVVKGNLDDIETISYIFTRFMEKVDAAQEYGSFFELPASWRGRKLKFREEKDYNTFVIFGLSLVVAVLVHINPKIKEKKKIKERDKSSLAEYPEIISKFIVFMGAGLSVRNVWDKVVFDYEKAKKGREIYVYEEMKRAVSKLKSGVHEAIVYREFSKALHLRQYTKFISILEQNRRTGLANIKSLLEEESQKAWDERLSLARRQGQEMGTKLLLPMFIMLIIVLVVVAAPAMLNINM